MRLLRNFHLILFSKNQLLHDNIGRRGVFLASNSLHDLWGQKKICPCLNSLNFEQIQWNKIFHRMYGLAVNLIMSVSGHPSIINEIWKRFSTLFFIVWVKCVVPIKHVCTLLEGDGLNSQFFWKWTKANPVKYLAGPPLLPSCKFG